MVGDPAAALVTGGVQIAVDRDPGLLLLGHARERERREERLPLPRRAEAAQRAAAGDPARVKADQVKAGPNLVGVERRALEEREADPGTAGPAGVDEQRADPALRIGGRQAHERDRDRRTIRLVVVERHLHRAALKRAELGVALAPADLRRTRSGSADGRARAGGGDPGEGCDEGRANEEAAEELDVLRIHGALPGCG